ncbi:MAG: CoA-binding protein [Proteobacteria bacterium]|nr:CoA-binding protein [Pseudomonadota bacterium]MBU4470961.1 CoA-binding protein [Pseudomonadota bacterium]MCG2751448.1 CoA-binding protein [Desulfobacteraceae bacterium]
MKEPVSLNKVFSPESVAIVGISGSGRMGFAESVLIGTLEAGCKRVYPVNPKYKEVFGLACYPDLKSIPDKVDHVVVSIPATAVMDLLAECAAKGVHSVHFFTAGFSESGDPDRVNLEKSMLDIARSAGFRILGPNCVGLYIPKSRQANITGVSHEPGGIAFISQSGGHAHNMVDYGDPRGLRFSKVVSYGNGLDVNEIELLSYFAEDPDTKIISLYIEGTKNGKDFKAALKNAALKKPVVLYKGGKSEAGKRATFGHTASMTSSVAVFNAVCSQANVMVTDSLEEMMDVLVMLSFAENITAGSGIALLGAGGGPSVFAGDVLEKEGLRLPALSPDTQQELKKVLPVDGSIFANPLDTPNMASPAAIQQALAIMGKMPEVHMMAYHQGFHPISRWGMNRFSSNEFKRDFVAALLNAERENGKPVFAVLRPPMDLSGMEEFLDVSSALVKAKLPVFYDLEKFAKALSRVVNWKKRQQSPPPNALL